MVHPPLTSEEIEDVERRAAIAGVVITREQFDQGAVLIPPVVRHALKLARLAEAECKCGSREFYSRTILDVRKDPTFLESFTGGVFLEDVPSTRFAQQIRCAICERAMAPDNVRWKK